MRSETTVRRQEKLSGQNWAYILNRAHKSEIIQGENSLTRIRRRTSNSILIQLTTVKQR